MSTRVRTVAILFGRKGSQGFPGKNLHPILGRPATVYPLLAAHHAKDVDRLFTSTDDPTIADLSREYGGEVLERPPELCTGDALLEDVIQHAYHRVCSSLDDSPEYVVILLCNSCNILAQTLDDGVRMLEVHSELDSVITACQLNMFHPLRARRLADDGSLQPAVSLEVIGDPDEMNCDRGSAGDVYFADGGMTVVRAVHLENVKKNLLPFRWMGHRIGMIEQLPGGSDIDQGWQVAAMEFWLREHGFGETTTPYDV